jgi:hypothetical protein
MGAEAWELVTVTLPVVCTVLGGVAVSLRRMGSLEQLAKDQGREMLEMHGQVNAHIGDYHAHRVGR